MAETTVFLGYDQAQLDAQYNNRVRFPDYVEHFDRWKLWSEETRRKLPCLLDVAFGPSGVEALDIFPAEHRDAPICVFIHGGYWYSLDKSDYSYVAEGLRPHGVTTVVNNFGLAPAYDMDEIVRQNRAALAWLWRNARRECGADPGRIVVAGHSAGSHLAMMLLGTDWPAFGADLPRDLVKGVCAIGGLFDLEPIRLSYLNAKLKLSIEQALRNSPIHATYPTSAPLLLVVGVDESEEYHRQSRLMRDRWQELGYPVDLVVPEDLDHFNVVNQLRQPDCKLVKLQLAKLLPLFEEVHLRRII